MDADINRTAGDGSPISDFYRGKSVFITGVTGFLGQCFLVKLMRIGARSVYILIRGKRDQSPEARFQKLIQSPIFEPLRIERPDFANHIIPIGGSLDEIQLNISQDDQAKIFKNVEIIIHCAADIRFDNPLSDVTLNNVRGTRELLAFARKMENFNNFVYVSTAYAFCFRNVIGEEFYEPPIDGEHIIKLAEKMKSEKNTFILDAISHKILPPWPNTYTFSKAITENLVQQYRKYFNVTIIRPSIVTATFRDPIEGWNTNFAGANGIVAGIIGGVLRSLKMDVNIKLDMVCCDFVINSALSATYDVSCGNNTTTPIYNVISSNDYVVTIRDLTNTLLSYRPYCVPTTCRWYPFTIATMNDSAYFILNVVLHIVPAILMDTILKIMGKRPLMMKIYRQVQGFGDVLHLFLTNSFNFENSNMRRVCKNMTPSDKQIFPCDFGLFRWSEYQGIYIFKGVVKCLLKETPDTNKMLKHSKKVFIMHYTTVTCFCLVAALALWWLIIRSLKY